MRKFVVRYGGGRFAPGRRFAPCYSMFLRMAYGLGNLFNDIRGEPSACAQDGPPGVPKTDRVVRLAHT